MARVVGPRPATGEGGVHGLASPSPRAPLADILDVC